MQRGYSLFSQIKIMSKGSSCFPVCSIAIRYLSDRSAMYNRSGFENTGLCLPYSQRESTTASAVSKSNGLLEERASAHICHLICLRWFSLSSRVNGLSAQDIKRQIEEITRKFMEAREMIDDAKEVKDTVYFSEDMQEATEAVTETLNLYQNLLTLLNDEQRQNVVRTIGLKMEELKAQKQMLEEESKHHDH